MWKGRTTHCSLSAIASDDLGMLHELELLILIDNLYSVFILFLCGLVAHICKVAIDRHDGWRCRVSNTLGRSTFPAFSVGRSYSSHDDEMTADDR